MTVGRLEINKMFTESEMSYQSNKNSFFSKGLDKTLKFNIGLWDYIL